MNTKLITDSVTSYLNFRLFLWILGCRIRSDPSRIDQWDAPYEITYRKWNTDWLIRKRGGISLKILQVQNIILWALIDELSVVVSFLIQNGLCKCCYFLFHLKLGKNCSESNQNLMNPNILKFWGKFKSNPSSYIVDAVVVTDVRLSWFTMIYLEFPWTPKWSNPPSCPWGGSWQGPCLGDATGWPIPSR